MSEHKHKEEWREGDEIWQLLGKASTRQPSARFTDDVVRAVRLLPEADPFWPRIFKISSWSIVTACLVLTASVFLDSGNGGKMAQDGTKPAQANQPTVLTVEAKWDQIEDAAEVELLAAAADHLDRFSDQELITMIGL